MGYSDLFSFLQKRNPLSQSFSTINLTQYSVTRGRTVSWRTALNKLACELEDGGGFWLFSDLGEPMSSPWSNGPGLSMQERWLSMSLQASHQQPSLCLLQVPALTTLDDALWPKSVSQVKCFPFPLELLLAWEVFSLFFFFCLSLCLFLSFNHSNRKETIAINIQRFN